MNEKLKIVIIEKLKKLLEIRQKTTDDLAEQFGESKYHLRERISENKVYIHNLYSYILSCKARIIVRIYDKNKVMLYSVRARDIEKLSLKLSETCRKLILKKHRHLTHFADEHNEYNVDIYKHLSIFSKASLDHVFKYLADLDCIVITKVKLYK